MYQYLYKRRPRKDRKETPKILLPIILGIILITSIVLIYCLF